MMTKLSLTFAAIAFALSCFAAAVSGDKEHDPTFAYIKAADRILPDTDDRKFGCARYRCLVAFCAPGQPNVDFAQHVAACTLYDRLGNDCGSITGDLLRNDAVPDGLANLVYCPKDQTLTSTYYTIWRSPSYDMTYEMYSTSWNNNASSGRQVVAGECVLEEIDLGCKKGTKSGDCADFSACDKLDLTITTFPH